MSTTPLPLDQDMYAVLCAVKREFVGRPALRAELVRVINRAHEEALDQQEQVTAERKMRDGVAMSLERVTINGVEIPF